MDDNLAYTTNYDIDLMSGRPKRATSKSTAPDLYDSDYYVNRELSSLEFNAQVLEEAADSSHPLLERLKFLCIFSSNLDEFFMVRVAALKEQIEAGIIEQTPDDLSPEEQLRAIKKRLTPMLIRQTELVMEDVLPALAQYGVVIHKYQRLHKHEKERLRQFFLSDIFPILTPLGLDPGHPFPQLLNRSLNIAFSITDVREGEETQRVGVLQVPNVLPRLVDLQRDDAYQYVLLEEIIQANADILFSGLKVGQSFCFRVTRDADIEIAEDEASDLLTEIAEQTRLRRWGTDAVRLEIDARMPRSMKTMLMNSLNLEVDDVYELHRPLNLPDFMALMKVDKRRLKDTPFNSRIPAEFANEDISIFRAIRTQDVMVHHPFDSFSNTVVKFLNTAANDSKVLAIKITLYRAGGSSPVIEALKRAAMNGKSVTAFVELKARFDEENNILWARELEKNGVHVVYGILGLKTHSKIAMVVRRERSGMRTYVHLSTGNYNQTSARLYTDIGYFTAREEFGRDAIHLFNFLTAFSQHKHFEALSVAPINLREKVMALINREIEHHTADNPGEIRAKMNSLVDPEIIRALYAASQKGVKIQLLVRGICCLKPGIPGVSENIEVRSIVGRFLEHSRIFIFKNGGNTEVYLSSADWMPRNFNRRVELFFPIPEHSLSKHIEDIFSVYWSDTAKARRLLADGTRERLAAPEGDRPFNAQLFFIEKVKKAK